MEQYDEYYWVDGEFPAEHVKDMFDWMFEQANVIYSLYDDKEILRILKCN